MRTLLLIPMLSIFSLSLVSQTESEQKSFRLQFGLSAMWASENPEYFKSGGAVYFSAYTGPMNKKGAYYPQLRTYVGLTKGTAWMGADTQLGDDTLNFMLSMNHVRLPYVAALFKVESGEGIFHPFCYVGFGAGRVKGEHWLDIKNRIGSEFLEIPIQTTSLYYEFGIGFKVGKGNNHLEVSFGKRDWGKIPVIDAKTVNQTPMEITYGKMSIPTLLSSLNFTYSRTFNR